MTAIPVAAAAGVVTLVALLAGPLPFAVVVVALAAVLLVDATTVLATAGPRPVVLAAAVPGVGVPAVVALRPDAGWTAAPDVVAGGLLVAFAAMLLFGRRRDVTGALGATVLAGLVVGLGCGGLLLLRSLPDGLRWTLGVLLVVAAVEVVRQVATARVPAVGAAAVTVAAALLAAGILVAAANPPFGLPAAAGVAAVALVASAAAALVREALDDAVAAATVDTTARPPRLAGVLTRVALPVLVAAPAAYPFARIAAL